MPGLPRHTPPPDCPAAVRSRLKSASLYRHIVPCVVFVVLARYGVVTPDGCPACAYACVCVCARVQGRPPVLLYRTPRTVSASTRAGLPVEASQAGERMVALEGVVAAAVAVGIGWRRRRTNEPTRTTTTPQSTRVPRTRSTLTRSAPACRRYCGSAAPSRAFRRCYASSPQVCWALRATLGSVCWRVGVVPHRRPVWLHLGVVAAVFFSLSLVVDDGRRLRAGQMCS